MKTEAQKQRDGRDWTWIFIILIIIGVVALATLTSCSKDEPITDPLVGEWERYLPMKKDIILTGDVLILLPDGNGQFNQMTITWLRVWETLEVTMHDGSEMIYSYILDENELILYTEAGATAWRRTQP